MIVVGIAFAVFAALIQFFGMSVVASAFFVGFVLIILAALAGERLHVRP